MKEDRLGGRVRMSEEERGKKERERKEKGRTEI